jgi:3-hexulose-6-phosphate synthase / 6-phospho-3-hexuloisomerase
MNSARLQVAFDAVARPALERSVEEAIAGGADVIEIGTPLLKRYGVAILKEAREYLPAHIPLYADVKMLDFARLEMTPALRAGASEITALAYASDESLMDALRLATTFGAYLSVSTMNYPVSMLATRLSEIQELGINRFIAHGAGTDLQAASQQALERATEIRTLAGAVHLLIGGGFRPTNVHEVAQMLPATVIVGRSATTGRSIKTAVAVMRRELDAVATLPQQRGLQSPITRSLDK